MRTSVHAMFVDTRADDLIWTLDAPLIEALAAHTLPLCGGTAELRALGASHQVRFDAAEISLLETVACLPEMRGELPERAAPRLPGVAGYEFRSATELLGPEELSERVHELHRRLDNDPAGLIAAFPGHPLGVTALLIEPATDQARWSTWHAYPQSGELVRTWTAIDL